MAGEGKRSMSASAELRRRRGRPRVANPKPSTARMRLHRERFDRGEFCIKYVAFEGLVDLLVDGGFLRVEFSDDTDAIKAAFERYVRASRVVNL